MQPPLAAVVAELFITLMPHAGTNALLARAIELQLRASHALLRRGHVEEAARTVVPLLQRLLDESSRMQLPARAALSARERDVLARLAFGESNKLIARALDISPHTVKRHVASILGKLGVASRAQAAATWLRARGFAG